MSLVELAVVSVVVLLLAGIGVMAYTRMKTDSFDEAARETADGVRSVAVNTLAHDRLASFADYGGPTALAQRLAQADPRIEVKPLRPGQHLTETEPVVGVAVQEDGTAVFAVLSRSGVCWEIHALPGEQTEVVRGDAETCGQSDPQSPLIDDDTDGDGNPDNDGGDDDGADGTPVADDMVVDVRPNRPKTFTLAGSPKDTVTFKLESHPQRGEITEFDPATGYITYTPDEGDFASTYEFFYSVSTAAAQDTAKVTLRIGSPDNTSPSGATLICDPSEAPYNSQVTCQTEIVDDEDTEGTYIWTLEGTSSTCGNEQTCSFTRPSPGDVGVTVEIVDSGGLSETLSTSVEFINTAPNVSLDCTDSVPYGEDATCSASVSDENARSANVVWDLGPLDVTCEGPTCVFTSPAPGEVPVSVVAVDEYGADSDPADAVVAFTTRPPTEPVVTCEGPYYHGIPVECEAGGSVDPDGTDVDYEWVIDGDDEVCDSGTTCEFTSDEPGDSTVVVIVTDEDGDTNDAELPIVFENLPPKIESVVCSETTPYNQNANCAVVVSDANGDPLTYSWRLSGATSSTGCGTNSNSCSFTRNTPGSVAVQITVSDPYGGRDSGSGAVAFVNLPPSVSVSCNATSLNKIQQTTCSRTVSDPNGTAGITTSWTTTPSVANGCTGTAATCTFGPAGNNTGNYTPKVTVVDPYGESATASGPVIQVRDAAPVITSLTGCTALSNHAPATESQRNCTISVKVNDPDDTNAQVIWPGGGHTNAASLPSGVSKICQGQTATIRADGSAVASCAYRATMSGSYVSTPQRTETLAVRAVSGTQLSASKNVQIRFTNQAPVISGNAECTAQNGSNCTISLTGTDPEGGSITWTWPAAPSGTSRSGACNGTVSSGQSRSCAYLWNSPVGSATKGPQTLSSTRICDPRGNCVSRPLTVRWTVRPNTDAPVASVECRVEGKGWRNDTVDAEAGDVVECRIANAQDSDGISHHYWQVSGGSGGCNHSGGTYEPTCKLVHEDAERIVSASVRDLYCGTPRCVAGDGSRSSVTNSVRINWDKAVIICTDCGGGDDGGGGGGGGNQSTPSCKLTLELTHAGVDPYKHGMNHRYTAKFNISQSNCGSKVTYQITSCDPWCQLPSARSTSISSSVSPTLSFEGQGPCKWSTHLVVRGKATIGSKSDKDSYVATIVQTNKNMVCGSRDQVD